MPKNLSSSLATFLVLLLYSLLTLNSRFVQSDDNSEQTNQDVEVDEQRSEGTPHANCGGAITAAVDSQDSLIYPSSGLYNDNLDCQWTIEAPEGMVVEFTVVRLAVQETRDCGRDRLELFELTPTGAASSLSGRLCGYWNVFGTSNQINRSFSSRGGQTTFIRFLSDESVSDKGFELTYRLVRPVTSAFTGQRHGVIPAADQIDLSKDYENELPANECPIEAELIAKAGVIKYPRNPDSQYQNNANCSWLISAPPGNQIRITLKFMDIESKPKCQRNCCGMDKLIIFSGPNQQSAVASELCGSQTTSKVINLRTNRAFVQFKSNHKVTGRGFELYYERIERGGPSGRMCSAGIIELPRSDIGRLQSPGFNESEQRYPNDANCFWRISVTPRNKIRLIFEQISLEDSRNCTADSLAIFDGPNVESRQLGRYCGQLLQPEIITTSNHYAIISLTSDSSVSVGGFSVAWTAIEKVSHNSKNCDYGGCSGKTLELQIDKETEETLHSPNFGTGDQYSNDAWCSWLIIAPENMNVFVRFESFDLEPPYSGTTCYDAVTVYDGRNEESDLIGTYCGNNIPPDVLGSTNELLITFESDSSTQAAGFLAHYSAKEGTGNVDGHNCGVADVQPSVYNRIVGGEEAVPHSWPWQVSIQDSRRGWQHWCGGSILANSWIITAAHCVHNFGTAADFRVVVGEHNRAIDEGSEQVVAISQVIIHEKYNTTNTNNDIALFKLHQRIVFNRYVKPICLPRRDVEENEMCITTGWGDTRGTGNATVLNQLRVPILSQVVCNQRGWYSGKLTDRMLCAGYPEGRRDSCQGDSGGPLVCVDDGRWRLNGLTSWGEDCASSHKPGVYTRVVKFLEWIEQKTGVTNR